MAPVKNSIEERRSRPRIEGSRPRVSSNAAPLLLRLPRMRIDAGPIDPSPQQYAVTAEAEAPSSSSAVQNQDAFSSFNTQKATEPSAPTSIETYKDTSGAAQEKTTKSWLDEWTNGVIIFLVTVVVVTTLLLVLQSPTFRQSKLFQGFVSDSSDEAQSTEALGEKKVAVKNESAPPVDSNSEPMLTATDPPPTPLDGPKPLLIDSSSNRLEIQPSSTKIPHDRGANIGGWPGGSDDEEVLDLDVRADATGTDDSTVTRVGGRNMSPDSSLAAQSKTLAQPTGVPAIPASPRRITETEYAESNVEQLLHLLKQQRGLSSAPGADGFVQGPPMHGSAGVPARVASMPTNAPGFPGAPQSWNGSTPNDQSMPNAVQHGTPLPNRQESYQPVSSLQPPPALSIPYRPMMPSLMEEVERNGGQSSEYPPPQGFIQPPYRQ